MTDIRRRSLLAGMAALGAGACSRIGDSEVAQDLFDSAEEWHRAAHRALAGRQRLAPEYAPEDRSPDIRGNGSTTVDTPEYKRALARG
ncbi:MAG: molybdopterin-binding protein, partial [Pseudomonadota bacterium]